MKQVLKLHAAPTKRLISGCVKHLKHFFVIPFLYGIFLFNFPLVQSGLNILKTVNCYIKNYLKKWVFFLEKITECFSYIKGK